MKTVAGLLMIANAALFFFGSVQHTLASRSGSSMSRSSFPPQSWRACVGFAYCGVRLRFFVVGERDGVLR